MPKFKFTDGTELEFEKFQRTHHYISVADTTNPARLRAHNCSVYVTESDYQYWYALYYNTAKAAKPDSTDWKPRLVGLLAQKTLSGIPFGVYVPVKYNPDTKVWSINIDELETEEVYYDNDISSYQARVKLEEYNKKIAKEKAEAAEKQTAPA